MITACMVTLNEIEKYTQIACKSLCTRAKLVSEVIIAKPDSPASFYEEWKTNNITFKKFGTLNLGRVGQGIEHGIGLQLCVEKATNQYILFHDPDVFFYKEVDKIFMDLMQKYKLNIIGVSHCAAPKFSYTYFPYLSCCLFRKDELPDRSWLPNDIKDDHYNLLPGCFLIRPGLSESLKALFPNPGGDFDTGSLLWLWGKQQNWNWLSFQTTDVHTYSGAFNRGTVKITEKFNPKQPLLYHATSSTCPGTIENTWEKFKQAWEESNDDRTV